MPRKESRIGDLFEIRVPSGLSYLQYTHEGEDGTQLVRVLPGIFPRRPPDLIALSQQKELYFTFTTLAHAVRNKEIELLGNYPVPNSARKFPIMRKVAGRASGGKITGWLIGHGLRLYTIEDIKNSQYVQQLTPEHAELSIASIWPITTLAAEIERGWKPALNEEFEDADRQRAQRERQNSPDQQLESKVIDHYLYFSKRYNAEKAAAGLRSKGWTVEVRLGGDGRNWLALAKQPAPIDDIEQTRGELERLAAEFGGEYDGWGASV